MKSALQYTVNHCVVQVFLIRLRLMQCDQIGRFIGIWATFQSLWQQLICPNLLYSKAIFVKVSKSFIFLVKSFLGNFYSHLVTFYWSHCKQASKPLNSLNVFPFMPPSMLNFVIALFPFKNLSRDWKQPFCVFVPHLIKQWG